MRTNEAIKEEILKINNPITGELIGKCGEQVVVESNETIISEFPTFNNEYEILTQVGEGDTSKVFRCRSIKNKNIHVAVKILKRSYLERNETTMKAV